MSVTKFAFCPLTLQELQVTFFSFVAIQSLSHVWLCDPMDWLQHVRLLCPSPSPAVCSNSCPLSEWCHPTISSSVASFSSCLQSFSASGSFPMSQFFLSDGQNIEVLASASVLPMNIQESFPLGWTGWISLQSKDSEESSPTPQFKTISSLALSLLYGPTLTSIHDYWKNQSFDLMDLCW